MVKTLSVASAVLASLALTVGVGWTATAPPEPSTMSAKEMAPKLEGFVPRLEVRGVHFDFDKSTIRPADARILDKNAEWLKANSETLVAIDGGADQRGSMAYNQRLSERRAKAVKDYLVARGIAEDRIVDIGYGTKVLACKTPGEPCWQKNRRADFLVKTLDKQAP